MLCRRCRARAANRPRGLCWSCYRDPGIRNEFPSLSKFAQRGIPDYYGTSRPASAPTRALPGMPEKIAVLAERAKLGQELWHPHDAPWEEAVKAG